MCLLTFLPPGVRPDTGALANGAGCNPDGHGYAIVADGELLIARGLDPDEMIAEFERRRRRRPDGPALFHSRFATHGRVTVENCHPFPLGHDRRTVLAHNGVLPPAVQPGRGDPRSDTRIAAEDYLPRFGPLSSRRARLRLERWMTPDNKIVILTVDRRFRDRAYILNEASGLWHDGAWYSNDGYLPQPARSWRFDAAAGDDPWDAGVTFERCPLCASDVDLSEAECRLCGLCFDCGEPPGECLCYAPAALDGRQGH
jgi:glutamine amidotransferase